MTCDFNRQIFSILSLNINWGGYRLGSSRRCEKCGTVTEELFCPKCRDVTVLEKADSKGRNFKTTGRRETFRAWYPGGNKITYKKSTGDICDLPMSEFKKAYEILRETGVLDKTTPYKDTKHGSYYPPLLERYFIDEKDELKPFEVGWKDMCDDLG